LSAAFDTRLILSAHLSIRLFLYTRESRLKSSQDVEIMLRDVSSISRPHFAILNLGVTPQTSAILKRGSDNMTNNPRYIWNGVR